MITQEGSVVPLTAIQKKLVQDNIGLVGIHMRYLRRRRPLRADARDDDLFQEGCLGLIAAARQFEPQRGIPFASFALARIHRAVHLAGQKAVVPVERSEPKLDHLIDRRFRRSGQPTARETLGQRLSTLQERAAEEVCRQMAEGPSRRGDRGKLVRTIATERLNVADDEYRLSLREIARRTRSSFARVAACEQRMARRIREALEADPEFRVLRRIARRCRRGMDAPIGRRLERKAARAAAGEFLQRFQTADAEHRGLMLKVWSEVTEDDTGPWLARRFARLSRDARAAILRGRPEAPRRKTRSRRSHSPTG